VLYLLPKVQNECSGCNYRSERETGKMNFEQDLIMRPTRNVKRLG
jgi:hypothetical protein